MNLENGIKVIIIGINLKLENNPSKANLGELNSNSQGIQARKGILKPPPSPSKSFSRFFKKKTGEGQPLKSVSWCNFVFFLT
jgi:hypothetical protein